MRPYDDRFLFHGNAVPFGARFATPAVSEARAATALASIGGRATASESGHLLDGGFVRFEAAGSEVIGEELKGQEDVTVFRTRATAWIKNLRITGLLELGDLSVTLESRYEMCPGEQPHEPSFLRLAVESGNSSVCRQAWRAAASPELDWINGLPTYELALGKRGDLAKARQRRASLDRVYCSGWKAGGPNRLVPLSDPLAAPAPGAMTIFGLTPPPLKSGLSTPNPRSGCLEEPVVEDAVGGFHLEWPGAPGTRPSVRFYFGEYVVSKGYRRFTALRMVLTRSPRSELVIGEVALNGSKHP